MTKTKVIEISLLLVVCLLGISYLFGQQVQQAGATGPFVTNIGYTATSSAVVSVTTSVRIAATTTNPLDSNGNYSRVYTVICNPTTNPVAILMNADKAVNANSTGVDAWIASAAGYNACYEINDRNQYNGSIQASSTSQAAVPVSVVQYVQ